MNLELPFSELTPSDLDEYLARIDRELDAIFLEEVEGTLVRLRYEAPAPRADDAAA